MHRRRGSVEWGAIEIALRRIGWRSTEIQRTLIGIQTDDVEDVVVVVARFDTSLSRLRVKDRASASELKCWNTCAENAAVIDPDGSGSVTPSVTSQATLSAVMCRRA